MHRVGEGGVLMDKWLMVVIGWGIVGPILAIGVCYLISWRMGNVSWRPGCRLSGSRHCLHLHSLEASHQDGSQARHVRRGEEPLATSHLADAFTAARAAVVGPPDPASRLLR